MIPALPHDCGSLKMFCTSHRNLGCTCWLKLCKHVSGSVVSSIIPMFSNCLCKFVLKLLTNFKYCPATKDNTVIADFQKKNKNFTFYLETCSKIIHGLLKALEKGNKILKKFVKTRFLKKIRKCLFTNDMAKHRCRNKYNKKNPTTSNI